MQTLSALALICIIATVFSTGFATLEKITPPANNTTTFRTLACTKDLQKFTNLGFTTVIQDDTTAVIESPPGWTQVANIEGVYLGKRYFLNGDQTPVIGYDFFFFKGYTTCSFETIDETNLKSSLQSISSILKKKNKMRTILNLLLRPFYTVAYCRVMNLFLLHLNPKLCARYHCNKHVVKMVLEIAQMLYVAWCTLEDNEAWRDRAPNRGYKKSHMKHPISMWIRENRSNYIFAVTVAKEYTRRYGKIHKTQQHIEWLIVNIPPSIPDGELTQMPQAMPDAYKVNDRCGTMKDTVKAYRKYYIGDKLHFAVYPEGEWPEWLPETTAEKRIELAVTFKERTEKPKKAKKRILYKVSKYNGPTFEEIFGVEFSKKQRK